MKRCSRCLHSFPATVEFFGKQTRCKSGIGPLCRPCNKIKHHEWALGDRPNRLKREGTPEYRAKRRAYYVQNATHLRAQQKQRSDTRIAKTPVRKKCAKCHLVKWAYEFGQSNHYTTGLRAYCTDCHNADNRAYAKTHWHIYRPHRDKRRAQRKGAIIREKITLEKLAERDHWTCHICHKKVTRKNWSCDHLIPLARGGQHTWLNVALAHRICNSRRHVGRLIPAQLRLLNDLSAEAPGAESL